MEKSEFYRDAYKGFPGPLTGVRVLEATTTWAGPMCGCILGDFGADVIKVELPGGEVVRRTPPFLPGGKGRTSVFQATVNRNKRSLTLDLRKPEGRDFFGRLAQACDIVIESFLPGTMERWGLGYQALRQLKPELIYVSISGYGQFGPESDQPGYDPLVQAAGGFLSSNGAADGSPVKAPTFLGDDLGGLHGALGAMAALHHRDQTGEGQHVDVALLDAMLFQSNGQLTLGALGARVRRLGNEFSFAAPSNVFECRDGRVYLGALLEEQWQAVTRAMGRPELGADARFATAAARVDHREEVNGLVSAWTKDRTVATVVERCRAEGAPIAPVRRYDEAASDRHVEAREMLQTVKQEDGSTAPITGPAVKFSRTPARIRSGAPALGANTEEILREIGCASAEIRSLRERRIIG
jgi:formyl-CoA transferase